VKVSKPINKLEQSRALNIPVREGKLGIIDWS